jgi:hypothetical protein
MQMRLGYQMPLAGRAMWRPSIRRSVQVGQSSAEAIGIGAVLAPVLGIGLSGAIAYVGMRTALTQKGTYRALGWVVGIVGIIGGLSSLAWMMGFGSIPQSQLPQNGIPTQPQMVSEGTVQQP